MGTNMRSSNFSVPRARCEIDYHAGGRERGRPGPPQRGCRAGDPGAGRGGVSRDKGFSPSTPGSLPRGLCAVGWLVGLFADRTRQKLISQRALS